MIRVKKINDAFCCNLCFNSPEFEVLGDGGIEITSFDLYLCRFHAEQLADNLIEALDNDLYKD